MLDISRDNKRAAMHDISKRLRARREEMGITAAQLATDLGVSQPTISRWEGDFANKMSIEAFQGWCQRLGLEAVVAVTDGPQITEEDLGPEQRALLSLATRVSQLNDSNARMLRVLLETMLAR
jgi:transcriptional regulator with XRE-family HTH domain